MSAYRSAAEAEIRDAAVARLREAMPGCRIIHEINCASFGPNRIDVLAVGRDRIAAVEIKSERDKLDRLPAQIASMRGVAHHVIAALHEKFLTPWSENLQRGYLTPGFNEPDEARGAVVWAYPVRPRSGILGEWPMDDRWAKPKLLPPPDFIDLLWAAELRGVVRRHGLHRGASKLDMPQLVDLLRWGLPGKTLLSEVCATLRRRACVEADEPIEDAAVTLTPIPARAGIRPGGPRMPDCTKDQGPTDGLFRPAAGSVVAPGGGALGDIA